MKIQQLRSSWQRPYPQQRIQRRRACHQAMRFRQCKGRLFMCEKMKAPNKRKSKNDKISNNPGNKQLTLRSVGVGSGVGHGQDSRSSVLELEVLISELCACATMHRQCWETENGETVVKIKHQITYHRWTFHRYRCGWWSHLLQDIIEIWFGQNCCLDDQKSKKENSKRFRGYKPWHMNPGITRWKLDPANPNPFSPVQRARWSDDRMWESFGYNDRFDYPAFHGQTYEVFRSLGNNISTQFHDNASGGGSANGDIKEALGVRPVCCKKRESMPFLVVRNLYARVEVNVKLVLDLFSRFSSDTTFRNGSVDSKCIHIHGSIGIWSRLPTHDKQWQQKINQHPSFPVLSWTFSLTLCLTDCKRICVWIGLANLLE